MKTSILDLYIPSKKGLFAFREINTHQQRRICKSSAISNDLYCTEFLLEILDVIQDNCMANIDIKNINIHDLLLIAIGLKASSTGINIPLNIICNKCESKHKFDFKLDKLYSDLCQKNPQTIIISDDDYIFEISIPIVKKELDILYNLKTIAFTDDPDSVKKSFIINTNRYIQCIKNKNTNDYITFNNLNDLFDFYKILPIKTIIDILTSIQQIQLNYPIFDFICGIDKCDRQLYRILNYDIDKFYFILKLIFNESIIDIFKDIFYLQKIGISTEYAEQLTHYERNIIWGFFDELERKKVEATNKNAVEYGPMPPQQPFNNIPIVMK